MKKVLIALFTAAALLALAAEKLTPDALIAQADKQDGKVVTLTGKVEKFEEKTSKKGNKYTVFKVKGTKESVSVWIKNHLEAAKKPANGDIVEVIGLFKKEKKVGDLVFKNEVDASTVKDKPNGVKVTKKAKV